MIIITNQYEYANLCLTAAEITIRIFVKNS